MEAVRLRPSDVEVLKNVGLLLAATGRLAEGRPHLETATRLAPDDPTAFVLLGNVYLRGGNTEGAERTFRRALEIDPNNTLARAGLAQVCG